MVRWSLDAIEKDIKKFKAGGFAGREKGQFIGALKEELASLRTAHLEAGESARINELDEQLSALLTQEPVKPIKRN